MTDATMPPQSTAHQLSQQEIDSGKISALATVQKVMTEIPIDHVVKSTALASDATEDGTVVVNMGEEDPLTISDNALTQLCARVDIPMTMYRQLINNPNSKGWGPQLMANIFNEFYDHQGESKRFLARSYNGILRGWLSTS